MAYTYCGTLVGKVAVRCVCKNQTGRVCVRKKKPSLFATARSLEVATADADADADAFSFVVGIESTPLYSFSSVCANNGWWGGGNKAAASRGWKRRGGGHHNDDNGGVEGPRQKRCGKRISENETWSDLFVAD